MFTSNFVEDRQGISLCVFLPVMTDTPIKDSAGLDAEIR